MMLGTTNIKKKSGQYCGGIYGLVVCACSVPCRKRERVVSIWTTRCNTEAVPHAHTHYIFVFRVIPLINNQHSRTAVFVFCFYKWKFGASCVRCLSSHTHTHAPTHTHTHTHTYMCVHIYIKLNVWLGTAVAQWLRCCATNRKVAGSIPDGVIGNFHWHNPFDRTMALGSTQPLTEMSTRRISCG